MKITSASLAAMPEARRRKVLRSLSPDELGALKYHWPFWARKSQVAPEGTWRVWLILAGRGFGKLDALSNGCVVKLRKVA